jgi:type I restriction enzyme S subunit
MMMSVTCKVPELRFPEFSGEWEEKKLIELSKNGFNNGVFNDPKKVGHGYRIINVTDMYIDGTIDTSNLSRVELDEKEFLKNRVEYGDIFFTRSSLVKEGIAYSNINLNRANDLTFDGHLIRMSPYQQNCSPLFLYYNFATSYARKQFIIRGKTTTMTTIGQEDIASVKVLLPSKQEQEKIASFLSSVESKLEQLGKKKTLLEQYKKGVMQKIFSQELRFKDDNGSEFPEWVERKLGEIATFGNGKGHEQNIDELGKYIVVNSKFIASEGKVQKYTNNLICPIKKDSIVMVMSDVPKGKALGKCYYIDKDDSHSLNQRICSLKSKDYNNKYLFYILNRNPYFLQFDSGVGQTNLRKDEVLNCSMLLSTSYKEQTKIANFLSSLDKKIELTDNELEATKEFKKGLLQKMFV